MYVAYNACDTWITCAKRVHITAGAVPRSTGVTFIHEGCIDNYRFGLRESYCPIALRMLGVERRAMSTIKQVSSWPDFCGHVRGGSEASPFGLVLGLRGTA